MPEGRTVTININGRDISVMEGSSVAAALLKAGTPCRISVTGDPRTAVCGMGICFECRATIDGVPQRRTCQMICHEGMQVTTNG